MSPADGRPMLLPTRSSSSMHQMANIDDDDESDDDDSSDSNSADVSGSSVSGGSYDGGGGGDVANLRDIDEYLSSEARMHALAEEDEDDRASPENTREVRHPRIEKARADAGLQPEVMATQETPPSPTPSSLPPPAGEAADNNPPRDMRMSTAATIDAFPRSGEQPRLVDGARGADAGTGGGDGGVPRTVVPGSQGMPGNSDDFAATAVATLPAALGSAGGASAGAAGTGAAGAEEMRRPSRRMSLKMVAQAVRKRSMSFISQGGPRGQQYRQSSKVRSSGKVGQTKTNSLLIL